MSLQAGYYSRRAQGVNDPGKLDRSVLLLAAISAQDSFGEMIPAWTLTGTAWAAKNAGATRRFFAENGKHAENVTTYRIRHRADVREFMRLVHGDDIFEILGVEEVGRKHFLDLNCRAVDQSTASAGGVSAVWAAFTAYANSTGNTAIACPAAIYSTAQITFSGVASTRVMIIAPGTVAGAIMRLSLLLPPTLGIVCEIRDNVVGGTLLYSVTADGSGADAALELVWNGTIWTPFLAIYPA